MKKATYFLALVFAIALMSFSCSKEQNDPITPKTSGELYPTYMGIWQCDSTIPEGNIFRYNITINNSDAILYNVDISHNGEITSTTNFNSWKISGNEIIFDIIVNEMSTNPIKFTIVSTPTDYNMVLRRDVITYYLSK